METSLDRLLSDCKNEKISECLTKLKCRGAKLQRSIFTKMTKDILCDSLIFIAETLLGTGSREDNDGKDNGEDNEDDSNQGFNTPNSTPSIRGESNGDVEEKDDNDQNVIDLRPICQLFLNNRCPSGIKGKNCTLQHPKQCRKFLQGGRSKEGCQDWNCHLLHPRICQNTYLFGSCQKLGCKQRHLKTRRNPTEEKENHSFLWQKQIQSQIDKLAEMNLNILQALSQNQQRLIPVWNQAPQEQSRTPQPRWATNRSL
jgi:hypothetical protein